MSARVRLAVFDCDGTLVDGQAAICGAMDVAFARLGLPAPDRHRVRRVVGLSLPQAMARLLPHGDAALHAAAEAAYRAAFFAARQAGGVHEPLYDGIADLIDALCAAGWRLGIATGKGDRGLAAVLAAHGLTDRFCTAQTADRHPSKPDPAMLIAALAEADADPAGAVMIGDTVYDMAMARAAGVRALGVNWGYHGADELRAAGGEAVAADAAELAALLGIRLERPR